MRVQWRGAKNCCESAEPESGIYILYSSRTQHHTTHSVLIPHQTLAIRILTSGFRVYPQIFSLDRICFVMQLSLLSFGVKKFLELHYWRLWGCRHYGKCGFCWEILKNFIWFHLLGCNFKVSGKMRSNLTFRVRTRPEPELQLHPRPQVQVSLRSKQRRSEGWPGQ